MEWFNVLIFVAGSCAVALILIYGVQDAIATYWVRKDLHLRLQYDLVDHERSKEHRRELERAAAWKGKEGVE